MAKLQFIWKSFLTTQQKYSFFHSKIKPYAKKKSYLHLGILNLSVHAS